MLSQSKLIVCALVLGLAPYAVAQERAGQQTQPGQGQASQSQPGQQRLQTGQRPDEPGAQFRSGQERTTGQAGQERTTTQRTQETSVQTGSVRHPMDAHLAACLLLGSQQEIALSKFALQHAKNEQVKQFAQQMIADHSKGVAELQKFVGPQAIPPLEGASGTPGSASIDRERSTTTTATSTTRSSQDLDRSTASSEADRARGGEQARSSTDAASQPGARPGQTAQTQRQPGQAQPGQTQPGQSQLGQTQTQSRTSSQREVPVSAAIDSYDHAQMATQRMKIEHEVAQRCLALMQQELQKYTGEKFDQAYLGQQAGAHIQMIAMLDVFEQHASPELKQVIGKAKTQAQDHLRMANDLMEQVDTSARAGESSTKRGATNPAQPGQATPNRRTPNAGNNP